MKKFLALLMALTLCLSMAVPAFAAGVAEDTDVPAGAVVYEDDRIVVYDTRAGSSARSTDYGYVWFNSSGSLQEDNIYVATGVSGRVGMTLGIESSSSKAHAFAYVYNPRGNMLFLSNDITGSTVCELGDYNGGWLAEQKFVFTGQPSGTYRINVHNVYAPAGTRVMCWIYDA